MNRDTSQKTNLDSLIQKIKSDGIQEAERKSAEIIQEAKKKASDIIEAATHDSENMIKKAEDALQKRDEIALKALKQAARDIILNIQETLIKTFDSLIRKECQKNLTPEILEKVLFKIIEEWQKDKDEVLSLEVVLSESDKHALFDGFFSKLKEDIRNDIELKTDSNIEAGFRIGLQEEHFYYDFTDEGIADIFASYLNHELRSLLTDPLKKVVKKQ
ncbi:MAG: hypothetical protein SVW57_04065 [Thermodesulfobacteriota bacterium]|nr:hypothetical protein [Thermodesulfobacteriota bacterium]